jgi:uncharacterized protein
MTPPTILAPIDKNERIFSLDVLRGFVLLGILLMNIADFGLWGAYNDPTVAGGADGWNLRSWKINTMFFEGTMRGLFSVLFGVGMFVLTDRLEKKGGGINVADIYFRRTLWLIFFGLVHSYLLLWHGEILFSYGLFGLLIFSFRKMTPGKLAAIAIFLMLCGSLWDYVEYRSNVSLVENAAIAKQYTAEGKPLTLELKDAQAKWDERLHERSPEFLNDKTNGMRQEYFEVVAFLAPHNMKADMYYPYRYDLWDVFSMMLLGIALFKWRVLTAERSYQFYGLMALIGYAIGLSINFYELRTVVDSQFSFLGFSQATMSYYWGRLFTSMGHLGLIMIFCKLPIIAWFKKSVAAVGKMALTNYLMHSVICMVVFTGVGFGLFGQLARYQLYYVVFGIWIFQLIASPIWLNYFRFGPAEWLWRTLTYLKKQPMRKKAISSPIKEEVLAA